MKINNADVKRITEIKQYLLDPPVSFKLYDYALVYINDTITVLNKYPSAKQTAAYFDELLQQLKNEGKTNRNLRTQLKIASIELGKLTNK